MEFVADRLCPQWEVFAVVVTVWYNKVGCIKDFNRYMDNSFPLSSSSASGDKRER